jgi:hypothetical protein
MGWNHRILATERNGEVYFQVHEVYYNDDGIPERYTLNPISVGCETINGIRWTINKMAESVKKPVLWAGDKFPKECAITYECQLCGRNKFTRKSPHQCSGGYRKHHIEWKLNCK